ncbi:MAG: choice-of-anchor Q domain-containing protein [Crocinitomicaceae bacterium]|nr:choice-of-anchor Q domain-containing protein [Crocinitomicaceae bacterium]
MKKNILPLILLMSLLGYQCHAQSTIYVDQAATGTNTGSTWTDAYTDFQSALDAALSGDIINVGVGTYYPSKDMTGSATPGDPRTVTFFFDVDVEVHGGFVGGVQICDTNNATVFSGDIGVLNDPIDNAYNVCYSEFLTNSTNIDCITIQNGTAEAATLSGAGWYNDGSGSGNSSNPNFLNCYFNNNGAGQGGAIINLGSNGGNASPNITGCIFLKNISEQGGAIFNNGENNGTSSPIISQCQFIENYSGEGGAIFNYTDLNGTSKPTVSNSTFLANEVYGDGGAVFIYGAFGDGEAVFNNCIFTGNGADGNGGAMSIGTFGTTFTSPQINNCVFNGNLATNNGGAIWCDVSSPTIDGCTFEQNQCGTSGGAIMCNGTQGQVSSPDILNTTFKLNASALRGGAVMLDGLAGTCNPTFHYCKFIQNDSQDGGAVYADGTIGLCQPEFVNTIFSRNYATNDGGGLYFKSNQGTTEPRLEHCSLSKNQSGGLGTIFAFYSQNGGICAGQIFNSVSHGQNGIGLYITPGSSFTGQNTMHENGWSSLWSFVNGGNCVVGFPLYNDPLNDDLTLQSVSPAIDAGSATFTTLTQDLNGNARIVGANPDMGAYESNPCPIKLFVDIDATGANTGLDWTNAFNSLQDAIDLARSCMVDTIWVAEGTYKPSKTSAGSAANPNNRANTFYVNFDVVIQGGFQGFETQESQRDWVAYETILDGNLGAAGTNADNSYTVVEYNTCTNVSQLDGFTVRGGNSNGWSGATGIGGGILIGSDPIIRNCLITSNYGSNAGGISVSSSSANAQSGIINCDFINNSGGVCAGLMINTYGGTNTTYIANCTFRGNSASNGGALAFYAFNAGANCNPTMVNCEVWNNSAQLGAILLIRDANGTISNCTFGNNVGSSGKFYNGYAGTRSTRIENSIIWDSGTEISNVIGAPFVFDNCIVRGGYALGTNITNSDPLYVNAATGDLRVSAGSPAINTGVNSFLGTDIYDIDLDGNATEQLDIDLGGSLRVQATTIDLGCYEFGNLLDTEEEILETIASKVYPNPFSSGTNLTIERSSDEAVQLFVFNAMGQMIYSTEVSDSTSTIDTSDWLSGLYIVRIGEETLKVVKSN